MNDHGDGVLDTRRIRQIVRPGMRRADLLLLERQREQAVLTAMLGGLRSGRPGVVNITGTPGLGQNALLEWMAQLAEERGFRVLRAQATPAERELRYGAILQLLTPLGTLAEHSLQTMTGQEQPDLLPGLSGVLPALWEVPTLLLVENAQWLDPDSQRWLQALVRRLFAGIPVALVTTSGGVTGGGPDWLGTADAAPVTTMQLVLRALSTQGVANAVRLACGRAGDEEFVAAAEEASMSNHVLLHDALCYFADHGYPPVAARVPELRAITTAVIGDRASHALGGLPRDALAVLRALAVCRDLLDFSLVCALAEVRSVPESELRATLEAAGLTVSRGTAVRIRFPVVESRVLEDMPAEERGDLYARAAELAHRAAVDDEDIADILFRAPPLGADWVPRTLRHMSTAALWRGEYERATACLSRALQEPLGPAEREQLNLELAEAEVVTAPEAGERRLGELARVGPGEPAGKSLRPIDAGLARGNEPWAWRAAAEALAGATGGARDDLIALHWLAQQDPEAGHELMVPEAPPLPERPASPAQAGVLAWQLTARGRQLETARELARTALAGDKDDHALLMPRVVACRTLLLADDVVEAQTELDALLAHVRRGHARAATARLLAVRCDLHLRGGQFDAAAADADAAQRALPLSSWHPLAAPYLTTLRIFIALESGDGERARELSEESFPAGAEDGGAWAFLLLARARVACLDGRWPEALSLARESGRRLARRKWYNPALLAWRTVAARAALECGDRQEAARLSGEEVTLARQWGTAGATGLAELFAGRLNLGGPVAGIRGTHIPLGATDRLAYAWALTELAVAELDRGNRQEAARLLPGLTRFTTTYPSSRIAERVRWLTGELERPGARDLPEAWTTLTDAERRTASMAADGRPNREIAELLSVSRRTVELRLSSAYRKLGVSGRKELSVLVRTMEGRPIDVA